MRLYDAISGQRFDMNHPVWREHNRTKKGEVSSRLTKVKKDELTKAGLVRLYPSVSEISKVADGFDAFGMGAKWGRDMTLKAYDLCLKTVGAEAPLRTEAIEKQAVMLMTSARDKGSELHGVFHAIRTGVLPLQQATPDQAAFHDACDKFIGETYGRLQYETEVSFCDECLRCGGTCDVDVPTKHSGVDWKTLQDWREPRMSELAQVGGYALHFGWDHAYVCYWHQTDRKMRSLLLEPTVIRTCVTLYRHCLTLYEAAEQFDMDSLVIQ